MADVIQVSDELISVKGELVFPKIMTARKQMERLLSKSKGAIKVDFAQVTTVDSSALSFWFCCLRHSEKVGVEASAINLPIEMIGIAELVGLDKQFS
jgi:ABC-type transporter Mla MlaB component